MTSQQNRLTATILLFFTLTASASALPLAVQAPRDESFLGLLWNKLLFLIGEPEAAPAGPDEKESRQKEGPQMDPNGGG
jgi:hypothetical protein